MNPTEKNTNKKMIFFLKVLSTPGRTEHTKLFAEPPLGELDEMLFLYHKKTTTWYSHIFDLRRRSEEFVIDER